jgi:hypothetical protein
MAFAQANYNCLTPQTLTFSEEEDTHLQVDIDPAFRGGPTAAMGGHSLDYRFPVSSDRNYHVFLELPNNQEAKPGEAIQRVTFNGQTQVVEVGAGGMRTPILGEVSATLHDNA